MPEKFHGNFCEDKVTRSGWSKVHLGNPDPCLYATAAEDQRNAAGWLRSVQHFGFASQKSRVHTNDCSTEASGDSLFGGLPEFWLRFVTAGLGRCEPVGYRKRPALRMRHVRQSRRSRWLNRGLRMSHTPGRCVMVRHECVMVHGCCESSDARGGPVCAELPRWRFPPKAVVARAGMWPPSARLGIG